MLRSLSIKNVALIDDAELEFGPGLIALTGETGAGKSVIVTALYLALGGRAEREFIRHGSSTAAIGAVFANQKAKSELSIYREISESSGTSKLTIDNAPATVTHLRELTEPLAQILGQHAGQMLMDETNHLYFLDRFAGLDADREAVGRLFRDWRDTADELRRVRRRRDQLINERELLLFQKAEIEKAQIRVGEDEEIERERRILDSARALMTSATTITEAIGGEESSILDMIAVVRKELDRMAAVDDSLDKHVQSLADIDFQLEDLRRSIEQYGASIEDDPNRLEEINLRLDELYNLKKKYGGSEEAILTTLGKIIEQLKDRPDIDSLIASLEKQTDQKLKAYAAHALSLTEARRKAAGILRKLVIEELRELAIEHADFVCDFVYTDDESGIILGDRAVQPMETGLEQIRFLFSANPGEPARSLVKTASGGEISRVLLALKSAEHRHGRLGHALLVFDEVDVGIGGRTANEVAKKLKKLSASCQVLVITHLHQIARLADQHFVAEKSVQKGQRTVIRVRRLDTDGIKAEIDRMVALPDPEQPVLASPRPKKKARS